MDDSYFVRTKADNLRFTNFIMINDRPCQIVRMVGNDESISLTTADIFTRETSDHTFKPDDDVQIPHVTTKIYKVLGTNEDGFCKLADRRSGVVKEDLKLPVGELGELITKALENSDYVTVQVVTTCGQEAIVGYDDVEPSDDEDEA